MNVALLCAPIMLENRVVTVNACRLVAIPKPPIVTPRFEVEILDAPPVRIDAKRD